MLLIVTYLSSSTRVRRKDLISSGTGDFGGYIFSTNVENEINLDNKIFFSAFEGILGEVIFLFICITYSFIISCSLFSCKTDLW